MTGLKNSNFPIPPHTRILDEVIPNHPVFLGSASLQGAWLNSKALDVLKITKNTPDSELGHIMRSDDGEPTGLFEGAGLVFKVMVSIPPRPFEQYHAAIRWGIDYLNSLGVVGIIEASSDDDELDTYKALDLSGELSLWVSHALVWNTMHMTPFSEEHVKNNLKNRANWDTAHVNTNIVKLFLDGIPAIYTAVYDDPYLSSKQYGNKFHGNYFFDSPEEVNQAVIYLDKEGLIAKMHAVGDAAVKQALNAIEAARHANGNTSIPHQLSHAPSYRQGDIERAKTLKAVAELSPPLWAPHFLGELTH